MNMAKKNATKASPGSNGGGNMRDAGELGSPFTNPYTFIPFPDFKHAQERFEPSLLTADEFDNEKRYTGVLNLEVKTLSPLMTLQPAEKNDTDKTSELKYHKALTIGNDVIVPATSIRGSLRNLMTILTGSALGYLDTNQWLCQNRDLSLGKTRNNPNGHPILALVEEPGDSLRPGFIRLGKTKLITAKEIADCVGDPQLEKYRPLKEKEPGRLYVTDNDISEEPIKDGWMAKLSGKPVNTNGIKKEGLFLPNKDPNARIEISPKLWADYENRNRFGGHPNLKKDDLVWIEPINPCASSVSCEKEIASLQWARWGKKGTNLKKALPRHILPCASEKDGKVDMVTDLFGMVPMEDGAAKAFASRIRCHNLIFKEGSSRLVKDVTLAVLAQPHPGCIAFYRKGNAGDISRKSELKGYKVYRNSVDGDCPWKYEVQGVYGKGGKLEEPASGKNTKKVELLEKDSTGTLKIGICALSKREMSILLMTLAVDWKLGGGKPLGLGHCLVQKVVFTNEDGVSETLMERKDKEMPLPNEFAENVKQYEERVKLYQKSQIPVKKLRYPRSVGKNNHDVRREGLQWFSRHATPKKEKDGLQELYMIDGRTFAGQVLPELSLNGDDSLYGYDLIPVGKIQKTEDKRTLHESFEPFDENKNYMSSNRGPNTSPNANTRQGNRDKRRYGK